MSCAPVTDTTILFERKKKNCLKTVLITCFKNKV